jgi:beta-glucanase (GH16 family)
MLARAASAWRRCALGAAVLLIVSAYAVWGIPARVNAEGVGWLPVFVDDFGPATKVHDRCTTLDGPQEGTASAYRADDVRVYGGRLVLVAERRAAGDRAYTVGGLSCSSLTQQYGRYEFQAALPAAPGLSALVALTPMDGAAAEASSVQLLAGKVHVTNGSSGTPLGADLDVSTEQPHDYAIEWAPSGFKVYVDGKERFRDAKVSAARRWITLSVRVGDARTGPADASTGLPAEFALKYLRVYAYDPTASAEPSPSPSPPRPVAGPPHGAAGWWIGGVIGVALVLAIGIVIYRARPPKRRPGHRL